MDEESKAVLWGLSTGQLAALGTLALSIGGGLGYGLKLLVDLWIKVRKRKIEEKFDVQKLDLLEDEQLKDGFKFALKKQDRQITKLENETRVLREQYQRCMEEHAAATQREVFASQVVEDLKKTIADLNTRIDGYRVKLEQLMGRTS